MVKAAKLLLVTSVLFSALIFTSTANAFVWTESGDAGSLLPSSQAVSGIGALSEIQGNLSVSGLSDLEDLFSIYIPAGSTFSATTAGGASFDTQLFLFNSSGLGVYANDDISNDPNPSILQSILPAGHTYSPAASGIYYLGISPYDEDPYSAGGLIFPSEGFWADVVGPTGPGGGSTLNAWGDANGEYDGGGAYSIYLTGAYSPSAAVPEPATMSLFGLGLLGLLKFRRKRAI